MPNTSCQLPNANTWLLILLIVMGAAMLMVLAYVIRKMSAHPNALLVEELKRTRAENDRLRGMYPSRSAQVKPSTRMDLRKLG